METLSPAELTLYRQLLDSICTEMGRVLQRGAFSANIKERRDFSCALFNAQGSLVAQGRDIPVHLGSMPESVAAAIRSQEFERGDVIILNDPYHGGTHLPDITAIACHIVHDELVANAYVANRAHHADVGGISPGSLPLSDELFQEGLIIPPVKLVRRGRLQTGVLELICANSRTPDERRADLLAQLASLARGLERCSELAAAEAERGAGSGRTRLQAIFEALISGSACAARELVSSLPNREGEGVSVLELPEGMARIRVTVGKAAGRLLLDFSGSDLQRPGPFNAVRAITLSAVFYALRCLLPAEVPTTAGLLAAVRVVTKPGTIVDAQPPAAVAAGNVETSQRIVEAVFQALAQIAPDRIPAASQGTMNNLLIGATGPGQRPFTYYETIAGGHGAGPAGAGLSARHSHMTNSLNTPVEALEQAYPLRVRRYQIRRGSGGAGLHRGGDGIIRELEFLEPGTVTLLRQSCAQGPPGHNGGEAGQPGVAVLWRDGKAMSLPAACTLPALKGDRLAIETPGGGGWGKPRQSGRKRA